MVAKFLDHNNRELKQDDGDGNENGKKARGLNKKNNNFTRALRFSVYFSASLCDCDVKFLISRALFME